ncbi:MAG: hypothetical protein E6G41_17760 [Actinobacteria bacterium]|nr:MAG: hypothetical protein E6G41_17760 [Actinomycetota bacterium]
MTARTTGISGKAWRRIAVVAAVGLTIAALTGGRGSSAGPSPGPTPSPSFSGVPSDQAQDPAADLERERQAVQALNDASQQRFDSELNTANSSP